MKLLKCTDTAFSYERKTVVSNINFSMEKGAFLSVVGENGSGKSTLIKGIAGLIKPSEGEILFSKKTSLSYLPQQSEIQKDFPASVYEIVISGCLNNSGFFPFYTKKQKEFAEENIQKLKIENLKKKCYHDLSGGQQQKVLIARALCAASSLLLLDEPVTGLDPEATEEMYEIISVLNKKDGLSVIMVSHDIKNAVKYSDFILHLHNKQIFYGKSDDYRKGFLKNA